MSMIRQLRDLWGYQDRIRQLEACNARLADTIDSGKAANKQLAQRAMNADARGWQAEAERDKAIAERDATAKLLEEATASLIDAKRQHGKLNEEFDRLATMFREKVDEMAAAEQLLDEAGDQTERLNVALKFVLKERNRYVDQLCEISAITQLC